MGMTIKDVLSAVDTIAPFSLAEPWDNIGLLLGDPETSLTKILIALDVTLPVIEEAKSIGANLIVTHHPVIFTPLKTIAGDSIPWRLIQSGINVICAHTNLDKAEGGVNDALARILGLANVSAMPDNGLVKIGSLPAPMLPCDFASYTAKCLGAPVVKYNDTGKLIRTAAICGGSFAEGIYSVPESVQAFVTGEAKHHAWLEASRLGICFVEAGHFHTENVVMPDLARELRRSLPGIEVAQSDYCSDGVKAVVL